MKRQFVFELIMVFVFLPSILLAQQSNFQFSPPPIPWFEFEEGQKDLKVGGTLLYLKGKARDDDPAPPDMGGDIDVYGGGASVFYRYGLRERVAIDIGGTIVYAAGDVGEYANMTLGVYSFPVDLEIQPIKTDKIAVILFGGFNFTWMSVGIDYDDGTDRGKLDMSATIRGPQFGAQVAFKFPEFVLTPFFMITRLSGNADLDVSDDTGPPASISINIPASTAYFYGVDLVYLPWNITLSSLIQQISSSGQNNGLRTYVLTVSYRFQFDKPEDPAGGGAGKDDRQSPVRG